MNKAKLFLTAIGVFAIVGGAFALKAKSAFGMAYCTTTDEGTGCSEQRNLRASATGTSYFYVIKGGSACSTNRICNAISTRFIAD